MKPKLHQAMKLKLLRPGGSEGKTDDDRRAEPRVLAQAHGACRITAGWYVVETKRHHETLAHRRLCERGLESYCPRVLQWPRPQVGGAIGPLFPGYAFVQLESERQFHDVTWTPGVKSFVTFGDVAPCVDARLIAELKKREGPDGVIHHDEATPSAVRIVDGPLRGLVALVERRLPARQRVRVLMELLQRQTLVELPERWVRRA
jgi:transcription antitermination factor NusG